MKIEQITDKLILRTILKEWKKNPLTTRSDKSILGDSEMLLWRGVRVLVGFVNEKPVTINITHFGKRRARGSRGVWEPRANFYTAWTKHSERRKGYARKMITHIEREAVEAGCVRLKSLAGTTLGVRFHEGLGHDMWGFNDSKEILVNTPLVSRDRFPTEKPPMNVRKFVTRNTPLTPEEINEHIAQGLRHDYK